MSPVQEQKIPELSLRSLLLALGLTVLLAMSNSYLALKLGILTSASIPAAIISMGILRFFKDASILENNAVQTAASAGEAVAGGIVYTIPALIIIQFWQGFDYLSNFLIAFIGGILGVLFSIPLRRLLVHDQSLKFPEGRAIAEVLKTSAQSKGLQDIFIGGVVGACIELFQLGFKLVASSWSVFVVLKRSLWGFGVGFSATMVGAGYLIGSEMAASILLGAVIAWWFALPLISTLIPTCLEHHHVASEATVCIWNSELRYMGIGAMLFAGIWTFIRLVKPLASSIGTSFSTAFRQRRQEINIPRTDRDIPMPFIALGVVLLSVLMYFFFQQIFPLKAIGFAGHHTPVMVIAAIIYVLVIGFLFSVITAYLSGMVGVTASPGSSVVIAGMLFAASLLLMFINRIVPLPLSADQIRAAEAITIIIGSVVTGIAAIANDNTQDLKVGQLVGATPWRQQVMLLIGVLVSALVIPPVIQLLYEVYGIAGVMPHEGMDPTQSLPAPTAALMAAITEAVFNNSLPWDMMLCGALVILALLVLTKLFRLERYFKLSPLGVAIGMYLPLSSSVPLSFGGLIAYFVQWRLKKRAFAAEGYAERKQRGILIACGLVAGSALMDVFLAVPFALFHSPDALSLVGKSWEHYGVGLGVLSIIGLLAWINQRVSA